MKAASGNSKAAKITPGQVMEIRRRYAGGETQGALARAFQMSVNHIGRIVRGESWTRLPMREMTEEELRLSAQRMLEFQGRVQAGVEGPEEMKPPARAGIMPLTPSVQAKAEAFLGERAAPPSPLEGGEGGAAESDGQAARRMAEEAAGKLGDQMLDELKGEGK